LAGAVVDHNRLFEDFLHALADDAGDDVVRPAGREGDDQPDVAVGKVLRLRHGGTQHGEGDQQRLKAFHGNPPRLLLLLLLNVVRGPQA